MGLVEFPEILRSSTHRQRSLLVNGLRRCKLGSVSRCDCEYVEQQYLFGRRKGLSLPFHLQRAFNWFCKALAAAFKRSIRRGHIAATVTGEAFQVPSRQLGLARWLPRICELQPTKLTSG